MINRTDMNNDGLLERLDWLENGRSEAKRAPIVRGIVLAGCHSWGECELEVVMPRPLLPVIANPLICHVLGWLKSGGISSASVCANGHTSVFRQYLTGHACQNMEIDYCEDRMPRGPAGCARDAALSVSGDTFVVVEGSIVPQVDLRAALVRHHQSQAALTMMVSEPSATGERANGVFEPVGIYLFTSTALALVPAGGFQDIKEGLIPELCRRGERIVTCSTAAARLPRIANTASYLAVNGWAVRELVRKAGSLPRHTRRGESWIHESAQIDRTARLVGPVWIGPHARIGANAMIVGPTTIGAECVIADGAVITRSALWERNHVGAGAILDRSVVTTQTNVAEKLVVRNTLYAPSQRQDQSFLKRLASCCQLGVTRLRGARRMSDSPVTAALSMDRESLAAALIRPKGTRKSSLID